MTNVGQAPAAAKNPLHEDRTERLTPFLYIRWTSGPDYERAYLCIQDGEPDMCCFAEVSHGQAELFKAGVLASIGGNS